MNISIDSLIKNADVKESVGLDVRLDNDLSPIYRSLKNDRSDAREIERQAIVEGCAPKCLDKWQSIYNKTLILLNKSLDIELMAWLCEASLRVGGFSGCSKVFELMSKSIKKHGVTLYPTLDVDDDLEWKLMALSGLNGRDVEGSLIVALNHVPIIDSPNILLYQIKKLRQDCGASESNSEVLRDSCLFQPLVSLGVDLIIKNIEAIACALNEFEHLIQILNYVFKEDAPPTSRIKSTLTDALDDVKWLRYAVFPEVNENDLYADSSTVGNSKDDCSFLEKKDNVCQLKNNQAVSVSFVDLNESNDNNHIYTRSKALNDIIAISEFFKRTEPQSPLPSMLHRVVHCAHLSWVDLMQELMANKIELEKVLLLTGISLSSDDE